MTVRTQSQPVTLHVREIILSSWLKCYDIGPRACNEMRKILQVGLEKIICARQTRQLMSMMSDTKQRTSLSSGNAPPKVNLH